MSAIKSIVARLYRDNRGVSMVEYSILIGIITAATVGSVGTIATRVSDAFAALAALVW
jgi:Flp pilus assembly pilin Flp